MSTRERWIVYPLLFLTLGIALRDKVFPPAQLKIREVVAQRIGCEQLHVGGLLCDQAEIGRIARIRQVSCDSLLVNGPSGRPVVAALPDIQGHGGVLEILTDRGAPIIQLRAVDGNGTVTTLDRRGSALLMGYIGKSFGMFVQVPGTGQFIPVTPPWRFETKTPAIVPPQGKSQNPASPTKKPPPEKQPPEKKDGPAREK